MEDKLSLTNACTKWLDEIRNSGPRNVAKILVGCKKDLRIKDDAKHVTWEEGSKAADDFKFLSYVECSALLFQHCDTVFSEAVRTAILLENT